MPPKFSSQPDATWQDGRTVPVAKSGEATKSFPEDDRAQHISGFTGEAPALKNPYTGSKSYGNGDQG